MLGKQEYYMKWNGGHLVYLKDDSGRRIKTTFSKFYEGYDPEKKTNWQELVDLIPIDEKYEKERDAYEIELLKKKEDEPVREQLDLFGEYAEPIDIDDVTKRIMTGG